MDWTGFRPPADWRQDGGGAKGPCPICRSTDGRRAWVRLYGSRWAAGCPSCNASTGKLLPALGVHQVAAKRDPLERLRRMAAPRDPGQHATPATVLWSVATEHRVGDSPGVQRYICNRIGAWPDGYPWPDTIGIVPWGRLRPDVEAVLGAHVNAAGSRPIPIPWELWRAGGRGAVIVYRYHHPLEDDVGAVQAEFVMQQSADDVVRVELGRCEAAHGGRDEGPRVRDRPDRARPAGRLLALRRADDGARDRGRQPAGQGDRCRWGAAARGPARQGVDTSRRRSDRCGGRGRVAGDGDGRAAAGVVRRQGSATLAAPAGWPKGTDYADVRVGRQMWTS